MNLFFSIRTILIDTLTDFIAGRFKMSFFRLTVLIYFLFYISVHHKVNWVNKSLLCQKAVPVKTV